MVLFFKMQAQYADGKCNPLSSSVDQNSPNGNFHPDLVLPCRLQHCLGTHLAISRGSRGSKVTDY